MLFFSDIADKHNRCYHFVVCLFVGSRGC